MQRTPNRGLAMRAGRTALPIACALALAAAGCGDFTPPTGPQAHGIAAADGPSSQTDRPPEVATVPVSFFAFNPCIGAVEEFFGTATLSLQGFFLPTDPLRGHMVSRVLEDLETASGFAGISTSIIVFNGIPGEPPEQAAFAGEQTVQLSDDTGRRVIARIRIHATFVDSEFVVEFSSLDQRCVGPDEA